MELTLYRTVVAVGAAFAELFGVRPLHQLLKGIGDALGIAFSLLVCFGIIFIVGTAMTL